VQLFFLRCSRFIGMNIYVGNLPYSVGSEQLHTLFGEYGTVDNASVVMDKFTGQSRGFGFVEMNDEAQAKTATDALNGMQFNGRELVVNEARPREERPRREFRPRGNGGGGGGPRGGGGGGFRPREGQRERF
jgi:cold-inducible RNA-binding protein